MVTLGIPCNRFLVNSPIRFIAVSGSACDGSTVRPFSAISIPDIAFSRHVSRRYTSTPDFRDRSSAGGRPELDRPHARIADDLVALVRDLPDLGFQVIDGETDVVDARTRGPSRPVYCSRPARAKLRVSGSRR